MKLCEMQYGDHLDQTGPKKRWKFVAAGTRGAWVVRRCRGEPYVPQLLEESDWAERGQKFRTATDVIRSLERRVFVWGWLIAASLVGALICIVMGKIAIAGAFVLPILLGGGGVCDGLVDLDEENSETSKSILVAQAERFERTLKFSGERGVEQAHDDEWKKWYQRPSWTKEKRWTVAGRSPGAFAVDVLRLMLGTSSADSSRRASATSSAKV